VHSNEQLVRKLFSAFETNDTTTIDMLLADEVVCNAPGRGMSSGRRNGKQELFAGMGRLAELTGSTLRGEIHDVLASDDHVVVLQTTRGERDGHGSLEDREAMCSTCGTEPSWRSGSIRATCTRWTPSSPDHATT
jgi:uncharacterized protein